MSFIRSVYRFHCRCSIVDLLSYLDAICIPLVRKMAFSTDIVCPSKVLIQLQSLTAHSFRVVSPDAVRTHWEEEGGEGGRRMEGGREGGRERKERGK